MVTEWNKFKFCIIHSNLFCDQLVIARNWAYIRTKNVDFEGCLDYWSPVMWSSLNLMLCSLDSEKTYFNILFASCQKSQILAFDSNIAEKLSDLDTPLNPHSVGEHDLSVSSGLNLTLLTFLRENHPSSLLGPNPLTLYMLDNFCFTNEEINLVQGQ